MKNKQVYRFVINLTVALVVSLAAFVPGLANAAGNAVVSITTPAGDINAGEQFTININVSPNNDIAGMQFDLSFNPAIVTVNHVTEGNLLNQGGANTFFNAGGIDNVDGTVSDVFGAIISPGQTVSAVGTFAVITLTAGDYSGSSALTISNVVIGDKNSQPIPTTVTNGTVDVTGQTPEPPPPGGGNPGGGGGGGGGTSDTINLRGLTDASGQMIEDFVAADASLKVELRIAAGTIVQNKYGQALPSLSIAPVESQAASPGSIMVVQSYEIKPDGANFNGTVELVFRYNSSEIPVGVPVSNLYIALWDPDTMTWIDLGGTVDAAAGTVSILINHLSIYALMAHNRPADLVVTNFVLTPDEVAPGENVNVSIEIMNRGDLAGTYQVNLMLDNSPWQSRTVTVNRDSSETIVLDIISDASGEHLVSLGGMVRIFVVKKTPAQAAFSVEGLEISPTSIYAGEKANISAYVKNTGDLAGTYTMVVSVDDIIIESREITLDGGGSMTVNFSFNTYTVGEHRINIGGLEGWLEVNPSLSPVPVPQLPALELNSFSTTPSYDQNTNTLESVRIEYQLNQGWTALADARLVMTISHDGTVLEQVSLLTLSLLKEDGRTGELIYIPSAGWEVGEYVFQAELYNGEDFVQSTLLHNLLVTPRAIAKVVSWWTLGFVIGIATVLIMVLLAIVIYRRRDMLKS